MKFLMLLSFRLIDDSQSRLIEWISVSATFSGAFRSAPQRCAQFGVARHGKQS